jgi:hypothetical protein
MIFKKGWPGRAVREILVGGDMTLDRSIKNLLGQIRFSHDPKEDTVTLPSFLTITYWNELARAHLSEVVMILTATVLVLMDRPVRRLVRRFLRPKSRVLRFLVFVAVCSFGYAGLALAIAWLLRRAVTLSNGAFLAPTALALLLIVGIIAERQKQI